MPTTIFDKVTGQTIAYSINAALFKRARGGGGQYIEVPMFETAIEFMMNEHNCGGAFEPPLGPMGYGRLLHPLRKPFRTKDGYMAMMPYTDRNWNDFFDFVGRPELKGDARFASFDDRVRNVEILYGLIESEAPGHTTAEWVAFCDSKSVPCMPVNRMDDLHLDPHVQAVGLCQVVEHPTEGAYRYVRAPVIFDGETAKLRRHAPRLGEDSAAVLAEFGMSRSEIDEVLQEGSNGG